MINLDLQWHIVLLRITLVGIELLALAGGEIERLWLSDGDLSLTRRPFLRLPSSLGRQLLLRQQLADVFLAGVLSLGAAQVE